MTSGKISTCEAGLGNAFFAGGAQRHIALLPQTQTANAASSTPISSLHCTVVN